MTEEQDKIKLEGVLSRGYGIIPKLVMIDADLTIEAKAIYAYLASYAGSGVSAFPSISKICYDLQINEKRFSKHKKVLISKGYVEVTQERKGGSFASNVYTIKQFVKPVKPTTQNGGTAPTPQNGSTQNGDTQNGSTQNGGTNNNSSINNSNTNNNNNKKHNPPKSKGRIYEIDSIHYQLASNLFEKIKLNNPDAKEPNLQNWANDIRKMIELDKRKPEQVSNMIIWSQKNVFWSGVILSAQKLRDKYDTMKVQANNEVKQPASKPKFNNYGKKPVRKESKPDWAKPGYVQPEETALTVEVEFPITVRLFNLSSTHDKAEETQQKIVDKFNQTHGEGTFEDLVRKQGFVKVDGKLVKKDAF